MPVTIHELAKAAGVSITTVSRALNDSAHSVNEETKKRILALAQELDYRPNQAARSLRTERSYVIGIIADDIARVFTPLIIRGIQDYLKDKGYLCVIMNTDWNPTKEKEAIRELTSQSIDGVIFVESWHDSANIDLNIPDKKYVFVHRMFKPPAPFSVTPDETYGAQLAMEHLLNLGHRRIAYINGPDHFYASAERLNAYKEMLDKADIPFDPSLVETGDWSLASGYDATQKLLINPHLPTAIFAANDLMAAGSIHAIQDAGLRVPHDIALVGYDNREIAGFTRPSITTVTLPCYEMGQISAQMLLGFLNDEAGNAGTRGEIKVRGELIIRESCGADEESRSPDSNPRFAQHRSLHF